MRWELYDRLLLDPAPAGGWAPLLGYDPDAPTAIAQRCPDVLAHYHADRQRLAAVLGAYQVAVGADATAQANARRVGTANATMVVTGQQAGLATGPLYTIYKIVTAILLARRAEAEVGAPVIPVFWNATEDHDLSEVASFTVPDREWRAAFPGPGLAAETLPVGPAQETLAAWLETVADPARRAQLHELLDVTAPDYGQFSSAVVARLFRGTGLVVLEPRLLRPLSTAFFQRVVTDRQRVRAALAAGAAEVQAAGLAPTFTPNEGFGLFRIAGDGHRAQVLEQGGAFRVGDETRSEAALLTWLSDHPAQPSTGAWLRPLLQSMQLPVLAYVAGPAEFRYHLQLPPLFRLFGAAVPVLTPRNHATVLAVREQRLARQLGVPVAGLFAGPESFYQTAALPAEAATALAADRARLQAQAQTLAGHYAPLAGAKAVEGFLRELSVNLDKLHARAEREYLRQHETDHARVDRLFAAVRPRGQPQERVLNVLYVLEREPAFIAQLLATFAPRERQHYILYTGEDRE